jgi:hypothetical protein
MSAITPFDKSPYIWERERWGPEEWATAAADARRQCAEYKAARIQQGAAEKERRRQQAESREPVQNAYPSETPEQFRHRKRGERLACLIRTHAEQLRLVFLEVLAEDIGELVGEVLSGE